MVADGPKLGKGLVSLRWRGIKWGLEGLALVRRPWMGEMPDWDKFRKKRI